MEDESKASSNHAAVESKIRMYYSQIAAQGDAGGKRRQAIRKLQDQLKTASGPLGSVNPTP